MAWAIELLGAIVPGIIVGVVLAAWNKRDKKRSDANAAEKQNRLEIEIRRIDLDIANAELTQEIAMAIKRGTTNGEMNAALAAQKAALEKFRKVERMQMVRNSMEED